jgi:hypothetical protein
MRMKFAVLLIAIFAGAKADYYKLPGDYSLRYPSNARYSASTRGAPARFSESLRMAYISRKPARIVPKIVASYGAAICGGALGFAAGAGLYAIVKHSPEDLSALVELLLYTGIGATLGYTSGASLGVYASGRYHDEDGSYGLSFLGAVAGALSGVGLGIIKQNEGSTVVYAALLAPPAAVAGYELSKALKRRRKGRDGRHSLESLSILPIYAAEVRDKKIGLQFNFSLSSNTNYIACSNKLWRRG